MCYHGQEGGLLAAASASGGRRVARHHPCRHRPRGASAGTGAVRRHPAQGPPRDVGGSRSWAWLSGLEPRNVPRQACRLLRERPPRHLPWFMAGGEACVRFVMPRHFPGCKNQEAASPDGLSHPPHGASLSRRALCRLSPAPPGGLPASLSRCFVPDLLVTFSLARPSAPPSPLLPTSQKLSPEWLSQLEAYVQSCPGVQLVDPPAAIMRLGNRATMLESIVGKSGRRGGKGGR